jgi:hypothetical protein
MGENRMGKKLVVLVLGVLCQALIAGPFNSAVRGENETFQHAFRRFISERAKVVRPVWGDRAAYDNAVPYENLDHKKFPLVSNLNQAFTDVRNERFLFQEQQPGFARRNTWLYPYDGCWIRAALAANTAEKKGYKRPGKLFIFGDLKVKSKFATDGGVSWWYHVVPAVQDASGEIYALDPAIESEEPLRVEDWVKTMVSDVKNAKLAICHPNTYGPGDSCEAPTASGESSALSDIAWFLSAEWENVKDLGFEPNDLLGDRPPWIH